MNTVVFSEKPLRQRLRLSFEKYVAVLLCWLLVQQVITIAIGSLVLFALYQLAARRVNINGG